MSRLADIYKSEKKSGGGLSSTLGKAALEKIDPRKMFDQSGLMATMLPSLFKSYSATSKLKDDNADTDKKDGNTDTIKLLTSEVSELKTHSKIAAKNSMYLPEIARDINFLRMQSSSSPQKAKVSRISPQKAKVSRIPRAKSVRSPDGTSSFFKTSAARNKEYNDQFKKNSTSPTQVGEKKESGGLFSGLFSGLMDGVKNIFSSIVEGLLKGGLLIGLMVGIGKYFQDAEFRKSVNKAFDTFFTTVFGPDYKKYLYTGAAILLGAIVAVKFAMAGLQAAAAAAARSLFGLGGGPGIPNGPGQRNRTGRPQTRLPKSRGGGRYALAGAALFGLDRLFNTSSDNQDDVNAEDVNAADVNGITPSTDQKQSESNRKLGINADTGMAAVEGALLTKSAVDSVRSIKENLTPGTPDTNPRSNSPSRVTDMTAEEKRKFEVNRKNGMNPVEAKRQAQGFKTMSNTATNIAARVTETATKPLTKWGRFLVFVERKSGALFARLGIKLATMAGMAAVPVAGWVAALFELGFIGMDLWLIYEIWCDFSNQDVADNTPTLTQNQKLTSPTLANNESVPGNATKAGDLITSPTQTPSKASKGDAKGPAARGGASADAGAGITFASLTREQQDAVLKAQRNREGFYPPKNGKAGSLSYDLNNPGNILYGPHAAAYGAKPDTTGRGVGDVKGKFARFPTLERGVEAQRALWLSPRYANLPLDKAVNLWTTGKIQGTGEPGIENYKQTVLAAAGGTYVPGATPAPTATAAADGATPVDDFAKSEMGMALQLLSAIKSSSPSSVPGGGTSGPKLVDANNVKTQASADSKELKQASNVIVNNTNNSSASQTAQAALPTVYNDDFNLLLTRQYA